MEDYLAENKIKPPIRYVGSKFRLSNWIISLFPKHHTYIDVFGGSASIILNKKPSPIEIYNDLESNVVNLFRVIRDRKKCDILIDKVRNTPYSFEEFVNAYEQLYEKDTKDMSDIDRAYYFVIRGTMGFRAAALSCAKDKKHSWQATASKEHLVELLRWLQEPAILKCTCNRFRTVYIDHRDAFKILKYYDKPHVLFYCDPPYPKETLFDNGKLRLYNENEFDHERFLDELLKLEAMVIVSSYENDLYSEKLKSWRKEFKQSLTKANTKRTEVVWISPNAQKHLPLFDPALV